MLTVVLYRGAMWLFFFRITIFSRSFAVLRWIFRNEIDDRYISPLPEKVFSEQDLAVVAGNPLENAVEVCEKLPEKKDRKICCQIRFLNQEMRAWSWATHLTEPCQWITANGCHPKELPWNRPVLCKKWRRNPTANTLARSLRSRYYSMVTF